MRGFVQQPSAQKWGAIMMGPGDITNPGAGLLAGSVHLPAAPTFQIGATNGINWRYNSGSSANTVTGIRMNTSYLAFACRNFHSSMRAKTRVLTGPAATRQYIGFSTVTSLPGSDTPIANADSAFLIGWRTSDAGSAITVFRNSGAGAPSVTASPVVPTTGVTQYEISFTDTNPITNAATPGVYVRILSARGTTVQWEQFFETNIPAVDTMMMPTCVSSTTGTNANYDLYFIQCQQDQ